jgi:peptide/nickel transport system permease protein
MIQYTIRRLLLMIPVLFGVSFLTFGITLITPGDPVRLMLGTRATQEQVNQLRQEMGLNDPFLVQYGRYVWNALHGDLGVGIRSRAPIMEEILTLFPSTLQLTLVALCMALLLGIPTGIIAAMYQGKWIDFFTTSISLVGLSIPSFWLAIVFLIVFGVYLKWISVIGGGGFRDLIFPALCLAIGESAVLSRITRSSVLEVLREDYVRTTRAKGQKERLVMTRHILPNALIPVVTLLGMQFAAMLGGALFVENVFARPGLGRYAVAAISNRDYPQIQGMVLFTATVYSFLNLVVDLSYAFLDPRIRYE